MSDPETSETRRDLSALAVRWRAGLVTLWRCFRPAWLLLPLLIALVAGRAMVAGVWLPAKAPLEDAAIALLATTTALAALRLALSRRPFFLWATALLAVLLSREIHFAGTSAGVYVGLALLLGLAVHHLERLGEYLASRFVVNGLAMGLWSYAIAVSLDGRWWKPRARWGGHGIPGEDIFHVPLEESMEILGHVLISLAVLCARRGRRS